MQITVSNNAGIPNKYIRLLKWKIYGLNRKFKHLHYADVFVNKEGRGHTLYAATIRLGITGKDIIIKHKDTSPALVVSHTYKDAHRYLARLSRPYR